MRIIIYLDMVDFWINNYNIWISVVLFHLSMAVSKGPRDWESARYDPNRALSNWTSRTCQHYVIILINIAASFNNSFPFGFLRWLVVVWYGSELLPLIWRHDRSWISSVCNPYIVINDKHDDGTWTRLVSYLDLVLSHESLFCLLESIEKSLFRILWETWLICYYVVKIISQELSTTMASMTIKDGKKWSLFDSRSQGFIRLRSRLL